MPAHKEWARQGARLDGVDKRLLSIIRKAADESDLDVQITSAHNARTSGTPWHPGGVAVDVQLYKDGKPLPNFQSIEHFRDYEAFAQAARRIQQREHPELDQQFRWGGYFGGALRNPFNRSGYAVDSMHFDLGPTSAMGGGSWKDGLSKGQRAQMPGVVSVGMADRDPMDDIFGAPTASADVWGDLDKGATKRAGSATMNVPTAGADTDVWGDLEKRAASNVRAAETAPAPTTGAPRKPDAPKMRGSKVAALTGGIIEGIPIAGPLLQEGTMRASAGLRSLTSGKPYAEELEHVREFNRISQEENKLLTAGGHVGGAIMGTAPMVAAAPGAFGVTGTNMLLRMLASGATGAGIAGVDSVPRQFVKTGDVDPMQLGVHAAMGFGGGAVGPLAGDLAGAGMRKAYDFASNALLSRTSGVSTPARNLLMESINRDGAPLVQAELDRLGPLGMLADVGSALQGRAQGVAVREEGAPLIQAIKDRAVGKQERIREAVGGLGPAEDAQTVTNNIMSQRRLVDDVNYGRALSAPPPVDVRGVVESIDNLLQSAVGMQRRALEGIRGELVTTGRNGRQILNEDARVLHNLKGEIDAVIEHHGPGLGVPAGAVQRTQGALRAIRGELNSAIEMQVPGYANANAASSSLARRGEGVERGYRGSLSGSGMQNGQSLATPERFAAEFNALAPGEQVAQAKGMIARINQMMGVSKNDLGAAKNLLQGEEGWNTAKMATVLGDEPVNRLLSAVEREAAFGETANKVVGNSATASRTEAAKSLEQAAPMSAMEFGKVPVSGYPAAALKWGHNKLMSVVFSTNTAARDRELAKILGSQGSERDAFLEALLSTRRAIERSPEVEAGAALGTNLLTRAAGDAYRQESGPLQITVNPRR